MSLAEALRAVASIGAAPLSLQSIVEHCDAAAVSLIGCMRTRLFLLSDALVEGDSSHGRLLAMQAGAPDTEHPVAGCAGVCLRTQQHLLYNDIAQATDFVMSIEGCGSRAPVSQAFAPVTVPGSLHSKATPLGVLQVAVTAHCHCHHHNLRFAGHEQERHTVCVHAVRRESSPRHRAGGRSLAAAAAAAPHLQTCNRIAYILRTLHA